MNQRFHNRIQAGQLLAEHLRDYANQPDVIVLGLPRGGVPVAYEIAKSLGVPLDIWLVRKLGVPGQEELAMGAIATGGVLIQNDGIIQSLHISQKTLQEVAAIEQMELERRDRAYRGDRPLPKLSDQTVILVDDGIATGSTLRAAIAALKHYHPKAIVVAAPVAPTSVYETLQDLVDRVVCLLTPEPLYSIGMWYIDFSQTTDAEVCYLLEQSVAERSSNDSAAVSRS